MFPRLITMAWPLVLSGNMLLWAMAWNRVNASGLPTRTIGRVSGLMFLACLASTLLLILHCLFQWAELGILANLLAGLCAGAAVVILPYRMTQHLKDSIACHTATSSRRASVPAKALSNAGRLARALDRCSVNQARHLAVESREVVVPELPPALHNWTIGQITDLHLNGRMSEDFFHHAIDQLAAESPDLIAVTGDLIDDLDDLPTLERILQRLAELAPTRVILGNHDARRDAALIRSCIRNSPCIDLGGRIEHLRVRDATLLVAGNEAPWFSPPDQEATLPTSDVDFRLLLAHSPDEFRWAQRHRFDLMLCGHTHGGQFRMPGFGAVVCPIRSPLRFAAGMFRAGPTTMFVSRGLSGELPLRINCPPEITTLRLVPEPAQRHQAEPATTISAFGNATSSDQPFISVARRED